jgi:segregation and condensation protein A
VEQHLITEPHFPATASSGLGPTRQLPAAVRVEGDNLSPFVIAIRTVYEGPLDLLLDLIRKQNIDIYDIPMAPLTAQFLTYTRTIEQADIDTAGEFAYTASLLIAIKSKMLLPRDPALSKAVTEDDDPRRELVDLLLEHERIKAAAQLLLKRKLAVDASVTQPGSWEFLDDEIFSSIPAEGTQSSLNSEEAGEPGTFDLARAFESVLESFRERPVLQVSREPITVARMLDYVKRSLAIEKTPVSLRQLLGETKNEQAIICMFLALLEMVRLQAVFLRQHENGDLLIKKAPDFDLLTELNAFKDDWGD